MVDIHRAVKGKDEYPPLFTDTEVNNCFSLLMTQVTSYQSKHETLSYSVMKASGKPFWFRNAASM